MRKLKLMPDYACYPLWESFDDGLENVDPAALGLSKELTESLDNWSIKFDLTLDKDNPTKSGFSTLELENEFYAEGKRLFDALKEQLSNKYLLSYYRWKDSRELL